MQYASARIRHKAEQQIKTCFSTFSILLQDTHIRDYAKNDSFFYIYNAMHYFFFRVASRFNRSEGEQQAIRCRC